MWVERAKEQKRMTTKRRIELRVVEVQERVKRKSECKERKRGERNGVDRAEWQMKRV